MGLMGYNPAPKGRKNGRARRARGFWAPIFFVQEAHMADGVNPANAEFPTILGPDARFKGELSFEKGMRLMGSFEGKVNTAGKIHVTREAKMNADVEATGIVVEGEVHGNLSANDRIELKNSARYEGDLRASKLIVEEGAAFNGHVSVGPDAVKGSPSQPVGGRFANTGDTSKGSPNNNSKQQSPQGQPVK
jgi:cytoskeletal protein CcmA (bactofilin family)